MTTTHFLNRVMGNVFKTQTSPAIPTAYYLGLSTTTPNISGGNVSEPASSAGYARIQLSNLGTPSSGVITTTANISFAESTAAWGTVTYFVIYDALTSGNLLMYEALSTARVVEAATIVTIKAGNLTLKLTNPS